VAVGLLTFLSFSLYLWVSPVVSLARLLTLVDIVLHDSKLPYENLCALCEAKWYTRDQDGIGRIRDTALYGSVDFGDKVNWTGMFDCKRHGMCADSCSVSLFLLDCG